MTTSAADPTAVIFVNLVRFKTVNDTYGHLIGDRLLTVAGRRLLAQARHADRVGRLGGDEFLLVCPGVSDPPDALTPARRVHQHLHGPIDLAGRHLQLAASIGVTLAHPGAAGKFGPPARELACRVAKTRPSGGSGLHYRDDPLVWRAGRCSTGFVTASAGRSHLTQRGAV